MLLLHHLVNSSYICLVTFFLDAGSLPNEPRGCWMPVFSRFSRGPLVDSVGNRGFFGPIWVRCGGFEGDLSSDAVRLIFFFSPNRGRGFLFDLSPRVCSRAVWWCVGFTCGASGARKLVKAKKQTFLERWLSDEKMCRLLKCPGPRGLCGTVAVPLVIIWINVRNWRTKAIADPWKWMIDGKASLAFEIIFEIVP